MAGFIALLTQLTCHARPQGLVAFEFFAFESIEVIFGDELVKPVPASDIIARVVPFPILNALKSFLVDHALAPHTEGTLHHALDRRRHTCESMLSQSRQTLARDAMMHPPDSDQKARS